MLPVLDPSRDPAVVQHVRGTVALPSFDAAAQATLDFLSQQLPAGAWMITRVSGPDWVVLRCRSTAYPVVDGAVLRWSDSFCSRMVQGRGPRIAPVAADVPAYVEAPVGRALPIGGYVGIPLTAADGSLLGTLCAISPEPLPADVVASQPMLELQARLLSSLLDLELGAVRQHRTAARPDGVLTGAGWAEHLELEGAALRRHASPASVVVLSGVEDTHEGALVDALGAGEAAGRLGPDRCAVLLPDVPEAVAHVRATGLVQRLQRRGLLTCAGVAGVDVRTFDLGDAVRRADEDVLTTLAG